MMASEWQLCMRIRESSYRGWIPTFWIFLTLKAADLQRDKLHKEYPEYEYMVVEKMERE